VKEALQAGTVTIIGLGGDEIEAYAAHPLTDTPSGGVVVIHHMPGFDAGTKEITRRFASWGFHAVCPNLHHRDAPGADADDAAAANRAAGGVPDERLVGDVSGGAEYLRAHQGSNGLVACIGFCSGGRQSVLAACQLPLDAAVDCYGAFVLTSPPEQMGMKAAPIRDLLRDLSCPLLGLFGAADQHPAPAEVAELDSVLTGLGKEHDFHTFEGAGHAFLSSDRPSYRQAAAVEAWSLVQSFFGRLLAPSPS
jgi:carboxymethylenebutenolidase